jgi:pimeloyl-ACP methyl ester carboxylesterase
MSRMGERTISLGTLNLNVAEWGRVGRPLILLHGGSASWRSWAAVAPVLARDWHVLAPDLRGHGMSGWGPGYTLMDYADDIVQLVDRELSQPAVLVGHSMGGQVAVAFAARRPDVARGVVVGDAPLELEPLRRHMAANRPMNEAWRELAASGESQEIIATRLPDVPVPTADGRGVGRIADVVPEGSSWYAEMAGNIARLDPATLDAVIEFEGMHAGLEGWLQLVRCPVLLVQGDPAAGGLVHDDEVDRWRSAVAGVRHVQLHGVGHGLSIEAPSAFLDAIQPFLRELHRAAGASRPSPVGPGES